MMTAAATMMMIQLDGAGSFRAGLPPYSLPHPHLSHTPSPLHILPFPSRPLNSSKPQPVRPSADSADPSNSNVYVANIAPDWAEPDVAAHFACECVSIAAVAGGGGGGGWGGGGNMRAGWRGQDR